MSMSKTLRVFPANLRHVKQETLACQSAYQPRKPLGSGVGQARLASLWQLQSATREELRPLFFAERTLLPSVLDRAFKGEL